MKLKINFILKKETSKEVPIIAIINYGYKEYDLIKKVYAYKPLRYYTGIRVEPATWDKALKLPQNQLKKAELIRFKKLIEDVFNFLLLQGEITNENLKLELDKKLKGKTDVTSNNKLRIVEFIDQEMLETNRLKYSTKQTYRDLKQKLIDFETKINKPIFSSDLNVEMYKMFLYEVRKKVGRINSVWKMNKAFKTVLHEISRKYKIAVFNPVNELSNKEKVQPVTEDKLYLSFEHIQKIIKYEPETEKLRNTKLILLTLLFTGCRYSDVHKINPEFIYDKNGIRFYYARYLAEKTDTEIIVPILKPLLDAIEKNNGKMAYPISQSKFNSFAKELTELSELKEDLTFSFTDAQGKKQFETKKLFQFVTSHTGRRSFVTNLINYIPVTILTKITGHQLTEKSVIFGYNKISLLDNAAMFVREIIRTSKENKDHFIFELV